MYLYVICYIRIQNIDFISVKQAKQKRFILLGVTIVRESTNASIQNDLNNKNTFR